MLPASGMRELPFAERYSSDERLARLVARGSTRAFAVLYERHHPALSRYCRSIVGNDDDAQDALQSAMMHALAAMQTGERELHVRPWLFRIVHNEAISLLRRRRVVAPIDESIPAANGVEHALEQRERLATLVADLQTLTERQRSVLLMRELAGLSLAEIAGAQSISPGAAKQALFEARCALHELVDGRGMACEAVRHSVAEHDGRVLRGRKLRAHLLVCGDCRAFRASTERRSAELRMLLPPLPLPAVGLALARLTGATGGKGAGVAGVATSATVGGHAAGSFAVKLLAGATLMTAAVDGTLHVASVRHRAATAQAAVAPAHVAAHSRALAIVRPHAHAGTRHDTAASTPRPLGGPRADAAPAAPSVQSGTVAPTATTAPASNPSPPTPPADRADDVSAPTGALAAPSTTSPADPSSPSDSPPQATGASSPGSPVPLPQPDQGAKKGHGKSHDDEGNGNGSGQGNGNGNGGSGAGHGDGNGHGHGHADGS